MRQHIADESASGLTVDVVIPTYNRRDLLPGAIDSIKAIS